MSKRKKKLNCMIQVNLKDSVVIFSITHDVEI